MESFALHALADELTAAARAARSGRSARTVHGGQTAVLRQTMLALAAGRRLDEHENPGEATLQVLRGRVRLSAGEATWEGVAGDLVVIPPSRHTLLATEDSAVLLTVVVAAAGGP